MNHTIVPLHGPSHEIPTHGPPQVLAVPRYLLPIIVQVFDALEYTPHKFDIFLTSEERKMTDPGQNWFARLAPYLSGTEIIYPPRAPVRTPAKHEWNILKPLPGEEVSYLQKLRNRRSTCIAQRKKDSRDKRAYTRKLEPPDELERENKRKRLTDVPAKVIEYDLTAGTNTDECIIWKGNNGGVLRTPVPSKLDRHGRDIMGKAGILHLVAADFIKVLSKKGFVEVSTPDMLVLESSQQPEPVIEQRVRESMSQALPVFVKGTRSEGSWEDGLNQEHLMKLDIDMGCRVETMDFYRQELSDVESGDSEPSPEEMREDEKYEDVSLLCSRPSRDKMSFEHICAPTRAAASSSKGVQAPEHKKMKMHEFLNSVKVDHSNKFVLDLSVQDWGGIPYGALNYFNHAKRVTHTLQEDITYPDASWGLTHGHQIITWFHHDCDGKMTVVNGVTGAKVWTLFKPRSDLSAADTHALQLWLASRKDKFPKPEFGELMNILILPGDTLFMPPGMVHLVYTPVPSIFRGSSFWLLESLHLTAWARRIDSTFADILTNVDHAQLFVFQSLVRIALGLAVSERQSDKLSRSSLVCLYDMLINGGSYVPLVKKNSEYEKYFSQDRINRALEQVSQQVTDPDERSARAEEACAETGRQTEEKELIEGSRYHTLAVRILERILRSIGLVVPSELGQKKRQSHTWVEEVLSREDWWWGGEVVSVDRPSVSKIFPQKYFK
ncbi:JmjC domain-containing histone demethylation protein 1 [Marasmius tenuissimus]|uniref:JmjC domain-containing histone demethylation protein 1 n=1 Tax=Marasmius tenuissimus TaxID=585030 RepID=A0ABR2ZGL4_9AGAR